MTLARPKPVVPLLNVPFLHYQLALLRRHGVSEIVLACSYRVEAVQAQLGDGRQLGVTLRYALEAEPLGTAGGAKHAATLARGRLLVLNGDVLTDVDLTAMTRFHEARGARATIFLTSVEDPGPYGLVETEPDGRVRRFVEKPRPDQIITRTINAGIYLLERELLDLIPSGRSVSMEHDVFPALLEHRTPFYGFVAQAYWLDIGSPDRYRQAQIDLLKGAVDTSITPPGTRRGDVWVGADVSIAPSARVAGPAVVGSAVRLEPESSVGPWSVLGDRVRIGRGSRVEGAVLWEDVRVEDDAVVRECVVGSRAVIGRGARVDAGAVVADNEVVP